jgi:hypothetical protein
VDISLGLDRVLLSDRKRGLIVVNATGVVKTGDYDQNNVVNAADYAAWIKNFGSNRSSVHDAPLADGNFNGITDAADYVIWRKFADAAAGSGGGNNMFGSGGEVPEPNTAILFAIAVGVLTSSRRSSRAAK